MNNTPISPLSSPLSSPHYNIFIFWKDVGERLVFSTYCFSSALSYQQYYEYSCGWSSRVEKSFASSAVARYIATRQ